MMTIASALAKVSSFESTVVASALSILRVVVPAFAVVRILKWKIAIGPFPIGFCPPERAQTLAYGFGAVHWSLLPESFAALPISGASPSISINCAGKTTSQVKAIGALDGCEFSKMSSVTLSLGALVTDDTPDV
jgi:hypothetical protein